MRQALAMKYWSWLVLAVGLMLCGCDNPPSPPASSAPVAPQVMQVTPEGHLDHAQPKLPTLKLWLGAEELATELCTTDVQRMTGMMFRTNLAENAAMLFVFDYPHRASFYMKNTLVPLSAAYISAEGVILEIHDLQPKKLEPVPAESDRVQYVLETTQGWFQRHHIKPGVVLRTEKGDLQTTFFGKK
jgi:uncharacterized membrane protein (UPF0127 family)